LKRNYADLIEYIFLHIVKGLDFSRSKQDHEAATYSVWRDEEDYFIDWTQSSSRIKRSIDALGFPYVGAKMRLQDEVFTVDDAEEFEDVKIENRDAGKAIFSKDGSPVVICGSGLLKINSATRMNNGNYEKIDLSSRFRIRFKTANGAPIKK
jgi:methionyl-tRNA formyltransferase